MDKVFGLSMVASGGDFRLISGAVLRVIKGLPPGDYFWRGLIPSLGFSFAVLPFSPNSRNHGVSKYRFGGMLSLAGKSISLSGDRPFRFLLLLALSGILGASFFIVYSLVAWFSDATVAGWSSTIALILLTSMLQIVLLTATLWILRDIGKLVSRYPPYIIGSQPVRKDSIGKST